MDKAPNYSLAATRELSSRHSAWIRRRIIRLRPLESCRVDMDEAPNYSLLATLELSIRRRLGTELFAGGHSVVVDSARIRRRIILCSVEKQINKYTEFSLKIYKVSTFA